MVVSYMSLAELSERLLSGDCVLLLEEDALLSVQPSEEVQGEAELSDAVDSDELSAELVLDDDSVELCDSIRDDSERDVSTIVLQDAELLLLQLAVDSLLSEHHCDVVLVLAELSDPDEPLDELDTLLAECWLVDELVHGLLNETLLSDTVDGLLPDRVLHELDELELVEADDSELLDWATVLLLDTERLDAVLQEVCELWLVLGELDVEALLAVQPSDDRLHEGVDVLALETVQPSELSEHDSELAEDADDGVLQLALLGVEHDAVLGVELVLGVDQLLDAVETSVLDEVRLDAELAED